MLPRCPYGLPKVLSNKGVYCTRSVHAARGMSSRRQGRTTPLFFSECPLFFRRVMHSALDFPQRRGRNCVAGLSPGNSASAMQRIILTHLIVQSCSFREDCPVFILQTMRICVCAMNRCVSMCNGSVNTATRQAMYVWLTLRRVRATNVAVGKGISIT